MGCYVDRDDRLITSGSLDGHVGGRVTASIDRIFVTCALASSACFAASFGRMNICDDDNNATIESISLEHWYSGDT